MTTFTSSPAVDPNDGKDLNEVRIYDLIPGEVVP
jgi:hypothetical protein